MGIRTKKAHNNKTKLEIIFDKVLDKWVNKKIFYKCKKTKIWKPKFKIGEDFYI